MTTLNKLALVAILAVAAGAQTPCVTQAFYDSYLLATTEKTNALNGQITALQAQVASLQAAAAPFAPIAACASCIAALTAATPTTIVVANWATGAVTDPPALPGTAVAGTWEWQFVVMTQTAP